MSGTARKLLFTFSLLVLAFGAASWAALRGLVEAHATLHDVKGQEVRVRAALTLASALRDEYAHQAHTIILGDTSHLHLYEQSRERARTLLQEVAARSRTPQERASVEDIRRASDALDSLFRERVVPAVLAQDRRTVVEQHARLLEEVQVIQASADRLAEHYESAIGGFAQHVSAVQHASFRWTLALLVAATLFAAAMGVYIGRSVAVPVARLKAGAERLAAGDLEARIALDRPDEFGQLARQFNRMTAALKEDQERLVASERLAGIGRLAAGVAHELNNPLGVILGHVRLLQRGAGGALAQDLGVIEEETLRARDIVEGLLDLSRPLGAAGASGGEPVDLRALGEEELRRLREASPAAEAAQASVRFEGQARVEGHPPRLRQVLGNLLRNALEAAGPQGEVVVALSAQGEDAVRLSVHDSGAGLSAEAQARLFEPFFTTKPQGTGLGLAVSRAIAEAHGGRLAAQNHPAGGAVFTLTLPRRA